MSKLLGAPEVAERLGVPLATLRFWWSRGEGPASFMMGRRRKVREEALEAFIAEKEGAARQSRVIA